MPYRISLLALLCAVLTAGEAKPFIAFADWQPLTPGGKPLDISYYNLLARAGGGVELWFDANVNGMDHVIGLMGPDIAKLERTLPRFGAEIVHGYDADLLGRTTPIIFRAQASYTTGATSTAMNGTQYRCVAISTRSAPPSPTGPKPRTTPASRTASAPVR